MHAHGSVGIILDDSRAFDNPNAAAIVTMTSQFTLLRAADAEIHPVMSMTATAASAAVKSFTTPAMVTASAATAHTHAMITRSKRGGWELSTSATSAKFRSPLWCSRKCGPVSRSRTSPACRF
jgi:hypothetical protein